MKARIAPVAIAVALLVGVNPASGAQTSFQDLPEGSIELAENIKFPDSIPAKEHADGIFVELPEYAKNNRRDARYVQVYGSEADSTYYQSGNGPHMGSCVTAGSVMSDDRVRWNTNMSIVATVSPVPRNYASGVASDYRTVAPVRVDRITAQTEDKLTLETGVYFVDAETQGSRLLTKTTADFKLVREFPGHVKVFAARSANRLTYLINREKGADERSNIVSAMFGQGPNFDSWSAMDGCALTFSMPVTQGDSSSDVVQLETILEVRRADVEVPEGEQDRPQTPEDPASIPKEARIRPMQIGFSTSWLSQDTAPVLSISYGWAGKERVQAL